MDKLHIDIDEMRNLKEPYRVPEGYFSSQRERLLRIPRRKRGITLQPVSLIISVAASLAVLITLAVYFMTPAMGSSDLDSYIASLSDSELSRSITFDDFDTYSEYIITNEN